MRRSTRIASRGASKPPSTQADAGGDGNADDVSDASIDEPSDDEVRMPARKSRKTGAKKGSSSKPPSSRPRKRGRLAALQDIPMDILWEILGHLHPADLLHVARTTKLYRSVLMSRSAIGLWKDSYASAADELPPLPEDMTIPQFVSLCFDRICYYCLAPSVTNILWTARRRVCKKCASNFDIFPTYPVLASTISEELRRELDYGYRLPRYLPQTAAGAFLRDMVQQFNTEFLAQEPERRSTWLQERQEQFSKIEAHARLCQSWDSDRRRHRTGELSDIRAKRREDIRKRLTELGWGQEISKQPRLFNNHKLVAKSQKLTDKIWANIQQPLVQYLEELRAARLAREEELAIMRRCRLLADTYRKFCARKPRDAVLPPVGDIISVDAVIGVIEDTPFDQDVTEDTFMAAIDSIPQSYFDEWRVKCDDALVALLNTAPQYKKKRAKAADLRLATTMFRREKNGYQGSTVGYPDILVSYVTTSTMLPLEGHFLLLGSHPWSAKHLVVARNGTAHQLVELAGLNPRTATCEDMDERDPWYIPASASEFTYSVRAMPWRAARAFGQSPSGTTFKLLGPKQAETGRRLLLQQILNTRYALQCAHCEERTDRSGKDLREHLKEAHGIENVKRGDLGRKLDQDSSQGEWVYLDTIEAAIVTAEAGAATADGARTEPTEVVSGTDDE
ncbi:uncharacterized protein SCHCODRAFT_02523093 [Schizophyllum commune H4-8]|nr:uncharacterized protein SCHCODRAFT_02523093 [Schizophyllum commune H4-8]KAI5900797.1 hypothetical protein SCHCODRAFT_02523093 [Schizophyllum commune H4-8]